MLHSRLRTNDYLCTIKQGFTWLSLIIWGIQMSHYKVYQYERE